MGSIHITILVLLFFTELLKYWLGISSFMDIRLKRKWISIPCLILYIFLLEILNLEQVLIHLLLYTFAGIVIIINIEVRGWLKLKVFLASFMLIVTMDEIIGMGIDSFSHGYVGEVPSETLKLFFANIATICLICVLVLIKNKTNICSREKIQSFAKRNIFIAIIVLAIYLLFTIRGLDYAKDYVNNEKFTGFSNIVGFTSLASIFIIGWFMLYIKRINEKLEDKIHSEQMLREMQLEQYRKMLEKETDTRKYRHDINNQLICLEELMNRNNQEEAKKYVREMQNHLTTISKKVHTVGNEILDAILNYHLTGLDENVKIEVQGMCKRELNISNVDLCTIFANLIQNAVEELKREHTGDRYLWVQIKTGLDFLQIEIGNSLSDESLHKKNILESQKDDLKNHGLGLKNVKRVVEKNNGQIVINVLNDEFISVVTLKK